MLSYLIFLFLSFVYYLAIQRKLFILNIPKRKKSSGSDLMILVATVRYQNAEVLVVKISFLACP